MKDIILGAGITGLTAGISTGFKIFEQNSYPGGICSSYFLSTGTTERSFIEPDNGKAYRFELGGGHWIFGCSNDQRRFLNKFESFRNYNRVSSVYFHETDTYVPYPIQNNLRYLDPKLANQAVSEMSGPDKNIYRTMKEWQENIFGQTLCRLFFFPFHELYTAGLYNLISPQDQFKSPIDLPTVIKGASRGTSPAGYNVSFIYPGCGLSALSKNIAEKCNIEYEKSVIKIDISKKEILFNDSGTTSYNRLISTLPLNKMLEITGLELGMDTAPYTSVLVLNIGAVRGKKCPDAHWLYIPDSQSGFHRVGFYSNVDSSFLPESARENGNKVSLYVERAFSGGLKPSSEVVGHYMENTVKELQKWQYIEEIDVIDPTWIEIAYTWAWPDSTWRESAIQALKEHSIYQIGRYGKWSFQGIADSVRDGLSVPNLLI